MLGAIEAGGTKMVCAVGRGPTEIAARVVIPTTEPGETFGRIREFFTEASRVHEPVSAIGVASFGPVEIDPASPAYGSILATPKPGWTGASYVQAFDDFAVPIAVETDVNGAGLGEWIAGAGQGCSTLAYATIGTGIGAGVLKDGRPLSGVGHYEMGHFKIPHDLKRDPYPGWCPFHGDCLEGLANGPAIFERWGSTLEDLGPDHAAFDLEAEYLSHFALTIIMTHMPERIIMGGGVMKTPGLAARIAQKTEALVAGYGIVGHLRGDLSAVIVTPALGDDAGIAGALALAQTALTRS